VRITHRCLFCGGETRGDPHHLLVCEVIHGRIEADLPPLRAGTTAETYATSAAAAQSIEAERAAQRDRVLQAIRAAGPHGCTDDEIQLTLDLDGSSERPRRWELAKLDRIRIARDAHGEAVKRLTRTHRRAIVWVAVA